MSKIVQSPGEFISNMLEKHRISILKFSKDIHISQSAANLVVKGKTRISVPVAVKLAKYFNTVPEYWLKMQMDWDLAEANRDKKLMEEAKKISKFEKGPEPAKKAAAKPGTAKGGKAGTAKKSPGRPAKAKKEAVKKVLAKKTSAKNAGASKEKSAAKRGRPAAGKTSGK